MSLVVASSLENIDVDGGSEAIIKFSHSQKLSKTPMEERKLSKSRVADGDIFAATLEN